MTFGEVLAWMFVAGAVAIIVALFVVMLPVVIPIFLIAGVIWLVTNPHILGKVLLVVGLSLVAVLVLGAIASAFPEGKKGNLKPDGKALPERIARDPGNRTPQTPIKKGLCPVCDRQVRLTAVRGLVATHITKGERCSGMGRSPDQTKALALPQSE